MIRVAQKIKMIKIEEIIPNPYQIRRYFERKSLFELADSIKENGVLSPVLVRGGIRGYELVCGQRRVRAALIAGLTEIPAVVVRANDAQCAQLSMIENIQRQNLDFVEEAEGYYNLISYHRIKKEKLVKRLSIEGRHINEKIRLLSLNEKIRYKIEENNISESCARELLKIHDEEKQLMIIDEIVKADLTYQGVKELVKNELRKMASGSDEKGKKKRKHPAGTAEMSVFRNTVNKTVDLLQNSGAYVTSTETENEMYNEFVIRIHKI